MVPLHVQKRKEALQEPTRPSNRSLPWEGGAEDARTPNAAASFADSAVSAKRLECVRFIGAFRPARDQRFMAANHVLESAGLASVGLASCARRAIAISTLCLTPVIRVMRFVTSVATMQRLAMEWNRRRVPVGHALFLPQAPRDPHLLRIAFAAPSQLRLRPVQPVQFRRHDPPCLLRVALLPFLRVMILPCPADHLPQQFLSKRFLPVTPIPPNPSVFPAILRPPRRSSIRAANSPRPAGLSFGMPCSPSSRPTRSQPGRRPAALRYSGLLLHPYADSACSALSSLARAGFKCT